MFGPHNVSLGLCFDGFSPFEYSVRFYSISTVIITIYNLLPWLYMTHSFLFLTFLIPSLNSPRQNIDVYLCLWVIGCEKMVSRLGIGPKDEFQNTGIYFVDNW